MLSGGMLFYFMLLRGKSVTQGTFALLFASQTKYIIISYGMLNKAGF